jgi:hypothetical protein
MESDCRRERQVFVAIDTYGNRPGWTQLDDTKVRVLLSLPVSLSDLRADKYRISHLGAMFSLKTQHRHAHRFDELNIHYQKE